MYWFRCHRRSLLHLTLVVWVLAVAVMAIQGCLVQPDHNIAAPHDAEQYVVDGHVLAFVTTVEASPTILCELLQSNLFILPR